MWRFVLRRTKPKYPSRETGRQRATEEDCRRENAFFAKRLASRTLPLTRSTSADITTRSAAAAGAVAWRRSPNGGKRVADLLVGRSAPRRITPSGQIPHALRSALFRVAASRAHREGVAGTIGACISLGGDSHRAVENEQTGVEFVSVLGIACICFHAAIDHLAVALLAKLGFECHPVHPHSPDVSRYLA